MNLSFAENIRIVLKRRNMTVEDLAQLLGSSKQNVNQKLLRSDFKESDMQKYCDALNLDYEIKIKER